MTVLRCLWWVVGIAGAILLTIVASVTALYCLAFISRGESLLFLFFGFIPSVGLIGALWWAMDELRRDIRAAKYRRQQGNRPPHTRSPASEHPSRRVDPQAKGACQG